MRILENNNFLQILVGKTITKIDKTDDDEMILKFDDGFVVKFYHEQDCCESVSIESIDGDINDLLNTPLLICEEATNDGDDTGYNSQTWTFYKFATVNGYVTVRWLGESNGYYSESVDIYFEAPEEYEEGYIGDNYIVIDGYITHYKKTTIIDDITYYFGHELVIAKKNDKYAHGKDSHSALVDLKFKLAERNKHQYTHYNLDSVLSYEEAVLMYRIITGACRIGTDQFLKQNNIKIQSYSIEEIINLTAGNFGSKAFKQFFTK